MKAQRCCRARLSGGVLHPPLLAPFPLLQGGKPEDGTDQRQRDPPDPSPHQWGSGRELGRHKHVRLIQPAFGGQQDKTAPARRGTGFAWLWKAVIFCPRGCGRGKSPRQAVIIAPFATISRIHTEIQGRYPMPAPVLWQRGFFWNLRTPQTSVNAPTTEIQKKRRCYFLLFWTCFLKEPGDQELD